ncbi:hypothetical protein PISMIDRAFT_680949 [Pisolithus microcarpus 441]|uniref:Uncharacterized protein n=1 Tax=Pisolithus microcarpus 441 TaxID=765257 RepID=A0A0C9YAP9_9AGAM|nr:hypothetical protein BKA83DRAFT_680949 [Pisolithus microcarpus]KIK21825.1 hypothetical protein PISMIDRAFT_680949 [Pisolithus microcarpus 441]
MFREYMRRRGVPPRMRDHRTASVEALELMRALIGEMLVGHDLGICCITPASHRDGAHVDETAEMEGV